MACTSNHLIRTPSGWREAGELKVGDRVLEALPHYLSDFQWEALRGTLMGDGALSSDAQRPRRAVPLQPLREADGLCRLEGIPVLQPRVTVATSEPTGS